MQGKAQRGNLVTDFIDAAAEIAPVQREHTPLMQQRLLIGAGQAFCENLRRNLRGQEA